MKRPHLLHTLYPALLLVFGGCEVALESSISTESGVESGDLVCGDLADNDADGAIDCADPDCASSTACGAVSLMETGAACSDGQDNDGDGRVDCADPDCADLAQCGPEAGDGACGDGVDNDDDGVADCADPGCATTPRCTGTPTDPTDPTEPADPTDPLPLDQDGDGLLDADEATLGTDPTLADTDGDGRPDGVEVGSLAFPKDADFDGVIDALESLVADCDGDSHPDQLDRFDLAGPDDDRDADGIPNIDDPDDDDDGICDPGVEAGTSGCVFENGRADLCPLATSFLGNIDTDGDSTERMLLGDECDVDRDGDGHNNRVDVCPWTFDADQLDSDADGIGDACAIADAPEPCDGFGTSPVGCDLLVEEVLYNVSSAGGALPVDANGDGVGDASDDEFVELRNVSTSAVDLSGVELHDEASYGAGAAVPRHVFPTGTLLRQGQRLVVFGGGTPTVDTGDALVAVASSGALGLNNSGDELFVLAPDGRLLTSIAFGGGSEASASANTSVTRYPESSTHSDALRQHPPRLYGSTVEQWLSPGRCPDDA